VTSREEAEVADAIAAADTVSLTHALDGMVGDAVCQARCALDQFEQRPAAFVSSDAGRHFAHLYLLLIAAHEAVCHTQRVEQLLEALGEPVQFPPSPTTRERLRVARNLLAEHREERVLIWRLTNQHTDRVQREYMRLGVPLPTGTIDFEVFDDHSQLAGGWGVVGGLLDLSELKDELTVMSEHLEELKRRLRPEPAPREDSPAETVTLRFQIVGPITIATS
jgi:hypothetical protein